MARCSHQVLQLEDVEDIRTYVRTYLMRYYFHMMFLSVFQDVLCTYGTVRTNILLHTQYFLKNKKQYVNCTVPEATIIIFYLRTYVCT